MPRSSAGTPAARCSRSPTPTTSRKTEYSTTSQRPPLTTYWILNPARSGNCSSSRERATALLRSSSSGGPRRATAFCTCGAARTDPHTEISCCWTTSPATSRPCATSPCVGSALAARFSRARCCRQTSASCCSPTTAPGPGTPSPDETGACGSQASNREHRRR